MVSLVRKDSYIASTLMLLTVLFDVQWMLIYIHMLRGRFIAVGHCMDRLDYVETR